MSTLMTLERYAEARAEMETGKLRDEVLMHAGIAGDEWIATERAWLDKMGTEIERGRFELTNQYTRAFLARQRALQVDGAANRTVKEGLLPAPVEAAPIPPTAAASLGAPLGPVPSGLSLAASAWSPVAEESARAPVPPNSPPMMGAFDEDQPAALVASSFVAVQTHAPPPLFRAPDREVLPFSGGLPNADQVSETLPPASSSLEETLAFDVLLNARNIALPFVRASATLAPDAHAVGQGASETLNASPANAAPLLQDYRGLVAPIPASAPDEFDATETLSFAAAKLVRSPVTPFDRPEQPSSESALLSLPKPTPPPLPKRARPSADLPSNQPTEAQKAIQGFSLAQYAEICATVTAYPDQVVQIRSHYGLDVHAWMALHALWQDRFQRDPTLELRWEALVQAALARRAR